MDEALAKEYFDRGTRLLHAGKASDAIPYLEKACSMNPDHIDAAINLSGAYILGSDFNKALAILEPLSEREPDNAMIWTNLGAAYLGNPVLARDEEQKRAIAAFERALVIRPASPHAAYNIALIYRDRKENEKAVKWFRQAIRDDPSDPHARSMLDKLSA